MIFHFVKQELLEHFIIPLFRGYRQSLFLILAHVVLFRLKAEFSEAAAAFQHTARQESRCTTGNNFYNTS